MAVRPVGAPAMAAGVQTSMPAMLGLSAEPAVKATTIWPELLADTTNCSTSAAFCPTWAKMSKFDRALVPLIATLNMRCPEAVKLSSTKCRYTT